MSVTSEYELNVILAESCTHHLQIIKDTLTHRITEGLLRAEESAAQTRLADTLFSTAAGAIIASHRNRRKIAQLNSLKDEIDTIITWNTAK